MNQDNELIGRILQFMKEKGGLHIGWYVGITNDPERRLYQEHQASADFCMWVNAESKARAERIEKYFLSKIHTDGHEGGGEADSTHVYAFKKSKSTDPRL